MTLRAKATNTIKLRVDCSDVQVEEFGLKAVSVPIFLQQPALWGFSERFLRVSHEKTQ